MSDSEKISDDVKVTVSPVIKQDGREKIFIQFTENEKVAEAIIPGCVFIHNDGFDDDLLDEFKLWLKEHQSEVLEKARGINVLKAFFGLDKK